MAREAVREGAAVRDLRRLDEAGVLAEHGLRAEIIGGDLVIQGAPRPHHQDIVLRIASWLQAGTAHGGYVAVGPIGVELDPEHSVRPDVVFVHAERAHLVAEDGLSFGPDLVVEVAAPARGGSSRRSLRSSRRGPDPAPGALAERRRRERSPCTTL